MALTTKPPAPKSGRARGRNAAVKPIALVGTTKSFPKGLFMFQIRTTSETPEQAIDKFITAVKAWASRVLDEAGIEVMPRQGLQVAARQERADKIHFALKAIAKEDQLRAALDIAASKGDETYWPALWAAFRMMEYCGTAYAGATVANEKALFSAIHIAGGKKGGAAVRKVTPRAQAEIKRVMAATPRGQREVEKSAFLENGISVVVPLSGLLRGNNFPPTLIVAKGQAYSSGCRMIPANTGGKRWQT
jgi:hypothetical protein